MALTTVYRNVLDAPPISPPRYSLLSAVETIDAPGMRWEGGYEFISELGGRSGAESLDECLAWYAAGPEEPSWLVEVDPMVVWAEDPCRSTLGSRTRDWQGLARRLLLARQSYEISNRLAIDVLSPAVAANAGGPVALDVGPVEGLAQLEDRIGQRLRGPTAYLHMSPGTLAILVGAGLVRLDGARYVTPIGSIVVADAGYADNLVVGGDDHGSIVATGPVRVRLGSIEVPSSEAEFVDPLTNTVRVQAWRAAAVEVDLGAAGAGDPLVPFAMSARILAYPTSTPPG